MSKPRIVATAASLILLAGLSVGASAGTAVAKANPARTATGYAPARASAGRVSPELATTQICSGIICLVAANGGPWVVDGPVNGGNYSDFGISPVYDICNGNDTTTANCPYSGVPAGHLIFEMIYLGSGPWNGECVGDAYNSSGNPETSLDPCGNLYGGGGAGWGTIHWSDPTNCSGGSSDYVSDRWRAGMTTLSSSPGSVWLLNSPGGFCMKSSGQISIAIAAGRRN